jgi:CubicO group peptidase (beta-lactamase class C family)
MPKESNLSVQIMALVNLFLFALSLSLQVGPRQAVDRAMTDGVRDGVFPGAVVVIGTADSVLLARGYGHFTWSPDSPTPRPDSTLYDLASLTKVVAVTPAAMILALENRLDLDRAVGAYLPKFSPGDAQDRVTVRHLLEHRSGLRAFLPLHERARTAEEARQLVLSEPLRFEPGGRVVYSDLNAMLLGWVVERIVGTSLDRFVTERVFSPIGMTQTLFRPPRSLRARIAPVGLWRGHAIAGEVHDQNAARLGGVSGHAGLYSTGVDLARYAQVLLRGGVTADGVRLFRPGIVQHFTRRGAGNRALGWEVRDTTSVGSAGSLLSSAAFGHGGYTGTSVWIDPVHGLFVVILTNRVFAPRTGGSVAKLRRIRGQVADAALTLREEVCGILRTGEERGC